MNYQHVGTYFAFCCLLGLTSQGTKPGILGPVAIVSNSLLLLLPTDSPQRSILCGLLIQVRAIGHSVSSLIGQADV